MSVIATNVIQFKPRATDGEQIFKEYVEGAKSLPFLEATNIVWKDQKWDLTGVAKPERSGQTPTVKFPTLSPDFLDFMKAYVIWEIGKNLSSKRQVFKYSAPVRNARWVQTAMTFSGVSHPCDLSPEILDDAVGMISGSPSSKEQNAAKIGWFVNELLDHGMYNVPYDWKSPRQNFRMNASKAKSRIKDDHSHKMLSDDELTCLIEAFLKAKTPMQKLVSSIAALLCCAPMRIQEVLELPRDVDVYLDPGDGYQAGLRWFPKKGGMPSIKYVPKAMVPVVQKALSQIKEVTQNAHELAKGMVSEEVDITNLALESAFPNWPYIHGERHVKVDEALFVIENKRSGIKLLEYSQVYTRLSNANKGVKSIFQQLDITLKDGSFPDINTHKPRHYLNTIANKANVPQADIAKWSGRKSLQQNSVYDHETPDELLSRIKEKTQQRKNIRVPKIYKEEDFDIAVIREAMHSTPVGWCAQSLRQSPCDMFGSCLNCSQLVCVKGADQKLENIKRDLTLTRDLKVKAEEKIAAGLRVNERWIQQYDTKIERLSQLVSILEDETVEDGSFVMMADAHDLVQFNPIEDALEKHSKRPERVSSPKSRKKISK